jgi:hypothetical protein
MVLATGLSLQGDVASRNGPIARAAGGRFDVRRLRLDARKDDSRADGPSSSVCVLPVALPATFDLSVDYQIGPDQSPEIELAGASIALVAPSTGPDGGEAAWHTLHLKRDRTSLACRIDGRPARCRPGDGPRPPMLSLRVPPGVDLQLRNLSIRW